MDFIAFHGDFYCIEYHKKEVACNGLLFNNIYQQPPHKGVLFGHHFAAIAGAGPLVGPVLAAQMGYLPGMLWIIFGVVFAGAVQDMMVLFVSMRRDGKSLGDIVKQELGTVPGVIASIGILMIMVFEKRLKQEDYDRNA